MDLLIMIVRARNHLVMGMELNLILQAEYIWCTG